MPRTVFLAEPPAEVAAWLRRRQALGQDRFDEVWEGEYHVAPAPHRRHGDVCDQVAALLRPRARAAGLWPSGPLNIGEPDDYRVPDLAYLRDRDMVTFLPSAAIVVEVASPGDESYGKFAFYLAHGVAEVLVVEPLARTVAWYAPGPGGFARAGRSALLDLDEAALHAEIDWPPA